MYGLMAVSTLLTTVRISNLTFGDRWTNTDPPPSPVPGHAGAILQAKQLGKYLVVGVHSDEEIFENKGHYYIVSITPSCS